MEETVDRISSLPDELLTHILSFVTTKVAVQTSILSKRWRHIWVSVPVLKFEYDNEDFDGDTGEDLKFEQFVDGVLQNRRALLDTVIYDCYFEHSTWEPSTEWLDRVALLMPRVIRVYVVAEYFKCPDSVFSCSSLESLNLSLHTPIDQFIDVSPKSISLPCLKTLKLCALELCENFMQQLFTGCPALESLTLHSCILYVSGISSNVLKNLTLFDCSQNTQTLRVSCPGLVSLSIFSGDYNIRCISFYNMASLVNADIKLLGYDDYLVPDNPRLVSGLSNATSLVLHLYCPPELQLHWKKDIANCTTFNNLKSLKIISSDMIGDFDLIACFLWHSPALQHLTLIADVHLFFEEGIGDTLEEARQDFCFQREYLEEVKIYCYNDYELASKLVSMVGRCVKTIGKIIIR
ncbi:F-box/FBD/LRR protein [Rhynchospora pubera]|uniref:F-box/FBD/LRR protein n=1 Tax=Rhynchospora pubera TaxID=906938 RepID=A0AAV8GXC0_9POAL|nr:F-box/FBD/LRR protein [Rhynchospora pubera]